MINIFEQATRRNLTFKFKGTINICDLWDLRTSELSAINEALGSTLSEESKHSLDVTPTKADETTKLKMAVVQHIYTVLKTEAQAKVNAKVKADEIKKLEGLLAKKQDAELEELTPAQIAAKIAALKA